MQYIPRTFGNANEGLYLYQAFHLSFSRFSNINSKSYSMNLIGQCISFNGKIQILSFASFLALTRVEFFLKPKVCNFLQGYPKLIWDKTLIVIYVHPEKLC